MPDMNEPGLVQRMKETSRGWTCSICFFDGKLLQTRQDGVPMSENDRCAGCGELVCDRHTYGAQRDAHPSGKQWHLRKPRVQVSEVQT